MTFDGDYYNGLNDYLKLTGYGNTGVAKGAAIKLMDSNNNHLKLGEKSAAIPLTAGAADVAFKATYAQVEGTVDAGTANGVATLLVTYFIIAPHPDESIFIDGALCEFKFIVIYYNSPFCLFACYAGSKVVGTTSSHNLCLKAKGSKCFS